MKNSTKSLNNNKSTGFRYPQDSIDLAKKLYMDYNSVSEIARETGMSRAAIYNQIKKWAVEREMLRAELMEKVVTAKTKDFASMAIASIEIIKRSLEDLAKRDIPPSVNEAQKATQIFEALDRITRLDNGDPTEITSDKPISIKAIKHKINLNPFKEIETQEIEKEIKNGEENENNEKSTT